MESSSVTATLSAESGPYTLLPYVSMAFVAVYAGGLALWCLNWLRYERLRVPLQRGMTILPCVKLASATMGWAYWWNCAPKGYEGTCSVPLLALYKGCDVLFNLTLYTMLMFLSKGVGVLRFQVPPLELRSILWNVVVLGVAMAAQALRIPVPYFLILLVILSQIYSNLSTNLQVLESYLYAMMATRINPITTPFFRKAFLLKKLQFLLTMYILLQVFVQFKVHFSTTTSELFECIANNAIDLCLLVGLGIVYRLRSDVTQNTLRPSPAHPPRRTSHRPSRSRPPPGAALGSRPAEAQVPQPREPTSGDGGPPPQPPSPSDDLHAEQADEADRMDTAVESEEEEAPLYQHPGPVEERHGSDSPVPLSATVGVSIVEVEAVPAFGATHGASNPSVPSQPAAPLDTSRPRTPASPITPATISAEEYHRVLDMAMTPNARSRGLSEAAHVYLRPSCPERWLFSSFLMQYDAPSLRTWHPRLVVSEGPQRPGDLPLGLRPHIPIHTVSRVSSPTPEQLTRVPFIVVEDPQGPGGVLGAISLGTRLSETPVPAGNLFPP